jgi:colanic acid biosynthesis glycosyl transferase WcaI
VQHWRVPDEKISLVPNGVETKLFSPHAYDEKLKSALSPLGKFVVSYIGTLGMAHGLETVMATAERLQSSRPEILFVIVGDGAERQKVRALAKAKGLSNVRFVPQQPRKRIPAYICASDVCLVTLKKSDIFETVVPTKMLEFMSCARPVIVAVNGQSRSIVESSGAGLYVPPEDSEALRDAIMKLQQQQPALRESMGRNGREYIVRNLSRQRTAYDYEQLLKAIVKGESSYSEGTAA